MPQAPTVSSNWRLTHTYDMLNLSASLHTTQTRRGFPCCCNTCNTASDWVIPGLTHIHRDITYLWQQVTRRSLTLSWRKRVQLVESSAISQFLSSPTSGAQAWGQFPRTATAGRSINDFINRDHHSLHFISVNDAVQHLLTPGLGALMAKVDLKFTFRMVPVHLADWEFLGTNWKGDTTLTPAYPLGCGQHRSSSTKWPQPLNGSSDTTMPFPISSTTWTITLWPPSTFSIATCTPSQVATLRKACWIPWGGGGGTPTTVFTFLGLQLDSSLHKICLPPDKLRELLHKLDCWSS